MYKSTLGIVLRTTKYNDSSMIVDMYTEQFGRTAYICSASQSKRAKTKSNIFQPLTILEFESDHRQNKNLQRLKDVKVYAPFSSIPYDVYKSCIAFFIADFLHKTLKEEYKNEELFRYIKYSMLWLDGKEKDYSNFHLVFLMKMSYFLGLYPNINEYEKGAYFDLTNSCFSASASDINGKYIKPDEAEKIRLLFKMNFNNMHLVKMSGKERNRCVAILCEYYGIHIPNFNNIKSLEILQEVLY